MTSQTYPNNERRKGAAGRRAWIENAAAPIGAAAGLAALPGEARTSERPASAPPAKIADAWGAFARSGDPNHPGLPHWPKFTAGECPTMIFDGQCVMRNNPDKAERDSLSS
jgi:carboxylesterase type B